MNLSMIRESKDLKDFYMRCGLCNKYFKTKSGSDKHFKSEKHLSRLTRWYELNAKARESVKFEDWDKNAKEVLIEEKRPEVVSFD